MTEKFIIQNDEYAIFNIPQKTVSDEWITFRIISLKPFNNKFWRNRLAYSRIKNRLTNGTDTKRLERINPSLLEAAVSLIQKAIQDGLI